MTYLNVYYLKHRIQLIFNRTIHALFILNLSSCIHTMESTYPDLQGRRQLLLEGRRLKPSQIYNTSPHFPPQGGEVPDRPESPPLFVLYHLDCGKIMRRDKKWVEGKNNVKEIYFCLNLLQLMEPPKKVFFY